MKRSCAVIWALTLITTIIPVMAGAAAVPNPSHLSLARGISCPSCHQEHRTLGASNMQGPIDRPSPAVFNNICQSCHRPGDGFAQGKPMALVDQSAIFGDHSTQQFGTLRQTSHRWDGSDTNLRAGAQPPIQAAMTTNTNGVGNLRGRAGKQLACVRCHSPHLTNAPGAMLRMSIDQAQMCVDCHRSRNQQSHLSGTHPVNVNYDAAIAKGNFNNPPLNANPANPSSDLSNRFTVTTPARNIVCTTCHGIHYTDSRSSTFDGASTARGKGNYTNLSTGDGYLLRTDHRAAKVYSGSPDKLNICMNCHANKKSHNGRDQNIQCVDCHGAHVEYDPNDPTNTKGTNVYLIRRNVTKGGTPSSIYFRYTGSRREYRNDAGTGVCQGCHNVPDPGGKYPVEHGSNKASDCNKCHYHSSQAGSFSGSCGQCHGMPPANAVAGAGGLASPATGALDGTAGAHVAHVITGLKMGCATCHSGFTNRTMPNRTIDIGFEINGVNVPGFTNVLNTGTYNNTNALTNGYSFTGSVGSGPNHTCNAIYCHGATLTGGLNSTPSWVAGSSQAQCGACHGASSANPPKTGGHGRHAGAGTGQLQLACASCHGAHNDNKHIDGDVQWNLAAINGQYKTPSGRFYKMSGSTGRLAPSSNYGTCTNIYCHSNTGANGTPIVYKTMTWGGSPFTCGGCHARMSTLTSDTPNGGHFIHASINNTNGPAFDCSTCHPGYTATSTNASTHANKQVDLNTTVTGYSKTSPMPSGGAWGTCSTNQCHGQATGIAWNNGSIWQTGGDICSTCHSSPTAGAVTTDKPFYSTEYPTKQTSNTNAKVGAHTYHLAKINLMSTTLVCANCHGPVALRDSTHMNRVTNFNFGTVATYNGALPKYDPATGTCSNVYCHGGAMPGGDTSGSNRTPSWKTPFMPTSLALPDSCNKCHGFPPVNASHPVLAPNPDLVTCNGCHPNVNAFATGYADVFVDKSKHINGVIDGGGCTGCHGYPPANKRFKGTHNNWSSARAENYSGAGGAHTVAGHIPPTASPSQGFANCTKCHNQLDHTPSPVAFNPSSNIKVTINPKYKFSKDRISKYTSNKLDGDLHVPGTCSNVACHFQKTPQW